MFERIYLARFGTFMFGSISIMELVKVFRSVDEFNAIFHLYVFAVTAFFAIGLELFTMYIQYKYHRTLKRENKWKYPKK